MTKIKCEPLNHYSWGDNCDGWKLIDSESISVIKEIMPPDTHEVLHYHQFSKQFFYIIEGTAFFIVDGKEYSVSKNESMIIESKQIHQIFNRTSNKLEFLVISRPTTVGDRIEINKSSEISK